MYFTTLNDEYGTRPVIQDVLEDGIGYVILHDIAPRHYGALDAEIVASARMSTTGALKDAETDKKLIRYLWEHAHLSPFEQVEIWFRFRAPLFVISQIERHRTFSYNQESGRYVKLKDEFYIPKASQWRKNDGKQTANKPTHDFDATTSMIETVKEGTRKYHELLERGIAKEQARFVLPAYVQYSSVAMKGNLRNFLHFFELRAEAHAQYETRMYAIAMINLIRNRLPWTFELWFESLPKEQLQLIENVVCYKV